jgi:hypothetical protein
VELMEEVAQRVEKEGIEAWFKLDAAELLGAEAGQYDKISDTLDVWFDSGTTHWHVLRGSHPTATPAARAPTCTWKAPTSTAAGSTRRCSPAAPSTATRPTRPC